MEKMNINKTGTILDIQKFALHDGPETQKEVLARTLY